MTSSIEAVRAALAAIPEPRGEWHKSRACVDIDVSEEWPSVNVRVSANKLVSPKVARYIAACNPVAIADLLATLDAAIRERDELRGDAERASEVEAQTIERCAIAAWSHFMDTCKRFALPPTGREDWCAASAIRSMRPTESTKD